MTGIHIINRHASACEKEFLQNKILDAGAVLVRNVEHTREDFLALGELLGKKFVSQNDSGEYRAIGASRSRGVFGADRSVFSVAGQGFTHKVHFHSEFSFQNQEPPHLLWFHCEKSTTKGGFTTLCDGGLLFASFSEDVQKLLLNRSLRYARFHSKDVWPTLYSVKTQAELEDFLTKQNKVLDWQPDGSVWVYFETPAVRMRGGVPIFTNSFLPFILRQLETPEQTLSHVVFTDGYAIARELVDYILSCSEKLTRYLKWQSGDIAIIDNSRVMHGRVELASDEDREVFVRMSDADFLENKREPHEQAVKRVLEGIC